MYLLGAVYLMCSVRGASAVCAIQHCCWAGTVAEAVHRAQLKVRLVPSSVWVRWLLPCAAGMINTLRCQLEAYQPLHGRLLLPLLNPAPKSAVASHAGRETCPWDAGKSLLVDSRAATGECELPELWWEMPHGSAGPWSPCVPVPGSRCPHGSSQAAQQLARAGTGSFLLPRCQPSQWLSRWAARRRKGSAERDAACRALSARCRSPPRGKVQGRHRTLQDFTLASQIPIPGKEQPWKMWRYFVGHPCAVPPFAQSSAGLCSHGVGVLLRARCQAGAGQGTHTRLAPGLRHWGLWRGGIWMGELQMTCCWSRWLKV